MSKWRTFFEGGMKNRWLGVILVVAFILRIIGVQYALPFRIGLDESSLVYGTLKMIELKTLIPSLHADVFDDILSYPPYIPYIYIPFFLFFTGVRFLQFLLAGGGFTDTETFKLFLVSDPSIFFLIARIISAFFGTATVFLVYKASKNIFNNEKIALYSAAFLALSFLHISFSHQARHWIYVTFVFALIAYILSRSDWSDSKKYTLALLGAGLGMGINYQAGLSIFFIIFWFLFVDKRSIAKSLKELWVYRAWGLSLVLALTAIALHPNTTGLHDSTIGKSLGLSGLLKTYVFYFDQMLSVEFIFLFFIIIGFAVLFLKQRAYFLASFIFSLVYIASFYFIYHTHDNGRYLLMLYPVFAVVAGYGLHVFSERLSWVAASRLPAYGLIAVFSLPMLAVALKTDYLLLREDTRVQALEWVRAELPPDAKFIVFVPFMKLPSTARAQEDQKKIDPLSVSRVDEAGARLPHAFYPFQKRYSINLFGIKNENLSAIRKYIESRPFDYLIYTDDAILLKNKGISDLSRIEGDTVKIFNGFTGVDGDVNNDFVGGFMHLFRSKSNGPTITIKKISAR